MPGTSSASRTPSMRPGNSWRSIAGSPASRRTSIVRPLRAAIDRGLLDRPTDVAGVRQVADQMAGAPGAAGLTAAASEHVAREERRRHIVAAARSWLTALGSTRTTGADVVIAPWLSGEEPIAGALWNGPAGIQRRGDDRRRRPHGWVARWSTEQSPFTFTVRQSSADAGTPARIRRATRPGPARNRSDRARAVERSCCRSIARTALHGRRHRRRRVDARLREGSPHATSCASGAWRRCARRSSRV